MSNINANTINKKNVKNSTEQYYEDNHVAKALFKVAFPIVIMLVFDMSIYIIDIIFVSQFVEYSNGMNGGELLGIITPLMTLSLSFTAFISAGFAIVYTKNFSKRNLEDAKTALGNSISFITILMVTLLIVYASVGNQYITSIANNGYDVVPQEAITDAYIYLLISTAAFIPMIFISFIMITLRVEGHTMPQILVPAIVFAINLVLDVIFIYWLGLDLLFAGVAFATSTSIGFILIAIYARIKVKQRELSLGLEPHHLIPKKEHMFLLASFGFLTLMRKLGYALNGLAYTNTITSIQGPGWRQFWTISSILSEVLNVMSIAIGQALLILLTYYVVTKNREKQKQAIIYGLLFSLGLQIIFASFFMLLTEQIFWIFNFQIPVGVSPEQYYQGMYIILSGSIIDSIVIIPIFVYSVYDDKMRGSFHAGINILLGTTLPFISYNLIYLSSESLNSLIPIWTYTITILSIFVLTTPLLIHKYKKI